MMVLVIGGAASGKSKLAEAYCQRLGGPLLYIATLRPWDGECLDRIERHRRERAGKGFVTLECYQDLEEAVLPPCRTALLECLGNLTANEMFREDRPGENPAAAVLAGIRHLKGHTAHQVLVHNDVFRGAERFAGQTGEYLAALGEIGLRAAALADLVVEAVCGLPVIIKGKELLV